jgi:hypothetical protein
VADAAGIVEFATVYPGWYPGRAVHVHVKAHLGGRTVLTSRLYFPDEVTDEMYQQAPYVDRGRRDTLNADDGIAGDPAAQGNLLATATATSPVGDGMVGLVVLGVDPGGAPQPVGPIESPAPRRAGPGSDEWAWERPGTLPEPIRRAAAPSAALSGGVTLCSNSSSP